MHRSVLRGVGGEEPFHERARLLVTHVPEAPHDAAGTRIEEGIAETRAGAFGQPIGGPARARGEHRETAGREVEVSNVGGFDQRFTRGFPRVRCEREEPEERRAGIAYVVGRDVEVFGARREPERA